MDYFVHTGGGEGVLGSGLNGVYVNRSLSVGGGAEFRNVEVKSRTVRKKNKREVRGGGREE